MANERLSKLQKWILHETYKLNIQHDGSVVGSIAPEYKQAMAGYPHKSAGKDLTYQYFEHWIYEKYYDFHNSFGSGLSNTPMYNRIHVTVHRAVENMEKKGLIAVTRFLGYRRKNWRITLKGIDTLRKLKSIE
jgi:hypothetical protein